MTRHLRSALARPIKTLRGLRGVHSSRHVFGEQAYTDTNNYSGERRLMHRITIEGTPLR